MKKLLMGIIGVALALTTAFAQTKTVSAYGKHEKPKDYVTLKAGDISLGANVSVFNRNDITLQTGINAKFFLSKSWALRGALRFGKDFSIGQAPYYIFPNNTIGGAFSELYDEYEDYPDPGDHNKDVEKSIIRKSLFMLNIGAEHRHKLSNRFFGYYGVDLALGGYGELYKSKTSSNVVTQKLNRSFNVELLPFIGFECFLGPKISLSTEFGYDFLFKFYNKNSVRSNRITSLEPQSNEIAYHIDFGNMTFATLRLAYYF